MGYGNTLRINDIYEPVPDPLCSDTTSALVERRKSYDFREFASLIPCKEWRGLQIGDIRGVQGGSALVTTAIQTMRQCLCRAFQVAFVYPAVVGLVCSPGECLRLDDVLMLGDGGIWDGAENAATLV